MQSKRNACSQTEISNAIEYKNIEVRRAACFIR